MPSTDLRVLKTRDAIKSHFLDLLLNKSFTDITVKDIADAARIGRGTFYLHYKDKFDLLDQLINEGLADVLKHFQPANIFKSGKVDVDKARRFFSRFLSILKTTSIFSARCFSMKVSLFSEAGCSEPSFINSQRR
ncbi:TetR/AcrR family transcriptional regulator [Terrilactibacillus sp. S3-3]|nr:TetR/AcrR family transcriptional regulator [Terrilactibacillus sp. S3-3]